MSTAKAAKALGFDLGREIEVACEEVSTFGEGAVSRARDSDSTVRSRTATWQNMLVRLQKKLGPPSKFQKQPYGMLAPQTPAQ